MATARSAIFDPRITGYYHCITRCVRRAFLCGFDSQSGMSYEHRRDWIQSRLAFLLDVFAIDCFAYAVMNNHLHMVIKNNPEAASKWSEEEVARRWRKIFTKYKPADKAAYEEEIKRIANNPELVEKYRTRLTCISWFNRCMNENIARRANKEDDCKGRFWEGRFYCQKLETDAAIIACSVYVDLNPIRAKVSSTLEGSDYTSIQDRINFYKVNKSSKNQPYNIQDLVIKTYPRLLPISAASEEITEVEYIKLVEETGKVLVSGKRGSIDVSVKPILERLKISPDEFVRNAQSQSRLFSRVIGGKEELQAFASSINQKWVHGCEFAERLFC